MNTKPALAAAALAATLLLGPAAHAAIGAQNSDDVLPNSPFKELGQPDAGTFNPAGRHADELRPTWVAPAAMTYYPPVQVIAAERPRKPYALVAAPTLPCAPGCCPAPRVRVRADRN